MNNVSIVIPVFNEERIIKTAVTRLLECLKKLPATNIELLLIQNGSTDKTPEILQSIKEKSRWIKVLNLPKPGIGKAIRLGINSATKKYILLLNADWIDYLFIKKAFKLRHQADIIVASKRLSPNLDQRPLSRKLGTLLLSYTISKLFNYQGTDTHGLKFINRKKIAPILTKCKTNEILETELLIRSQKNNLTINELPCSLREIRPARTSFIKRGIQAIRELFTLLRIL